MRCPDCERIRAAAFAENRVVLSFPTDFTKDKAAAILSRAQVRMVEIDDPECLAFLAAYSELVGLAADFVAGLTGEEMAHTRALVLPEDRQPSLSEAMRTVSLRTLAARLRGIWLVDMIEEERLFAMMQPIWTADGVLYGHESLLRGREADGATVPPGLLFKTAEDADLLFTLDLAARRIGLETIGRVGPDGCKVFINFNPSSIYDPANCLAETAIFIEQAGLAPDDIVFEVIESAEVKDRKHLRGILQYYRDAGFRVALDDVGAGFSGLTMLQELRPDIVKIDMGLIQGVAKDDFKQSIVRHLIELSHEGGAMALAEGIEEEVDRDWLARAGIDLMQGYLLGRPYLPTVAV